MTLDSPADTSNQNKLPGRDSREKKWQRLIGWLFSPVHIILFVAILCVFHVPLVVASRIFGQRAFDHVLQLMNIALIFNMRLAGTRVDYLDSAAIPATGPVIYVANHQSMYDIPFLIWFLRARMPRFIAKVELQKFLPSISFSLRNGNYLLIDRNEPKGALELIRNYAERVRNEQEAVCIFPEGTRARDGAMKYFKPAGLATLIEKIPDATIVPVCIDGSWKLVRHKLLPIPFGVTVHFKILKPFKVNSEDPEAVVELIEAQIKETLNEMRGSS